VLSWSGITDEASELMVQYNIDGGSWINTGLSSSSGSIAIPGSSLADGSHKICIRAVDSLGNEGSAGPLYATYNKDTTQPAAIIAYPSNLQAVDGILNITGSINDSHLAGWALEYGTGTNPSAYTQLKASTLNVSNQILYSWDMSSLDEGNYVVKLTASDTAGNTRATQIQIVKSADVININPELEVISPQDNMRIEEQINSVFYQRINGGVSTGLIGELYIDGKLIDSESTSGEGLQFDALNYKEGQQCTIYIKAKDEYGNDLYSATTYESTPIADTFNDTSKRGDRRRERGKGI
jgi:hypothetical protein